MKRYFYDLGKTKKVSIYKYDLISKHFFHILRCFCLSLKESVYKAMHPLICQFVGFQEAEITPHADGTATVSLNLKNGAHKLISEKDTTAHWRRVEGDFFLTSASVMLKNKTDKC